MATTLRAFLMLRTDDMGWNVSVFRALEDLLGAWKARPDPDTSTAVVHIGFDRPPSRDFELLARDHPGKALVTAAAKYALPADFRASRRPIGEVGGLPLFVGTRGWGYLLDDDVDLVPSSAITVQPRQYEGWVYEFVRDRPEAASGLRDADIWNDADYLAREGGLPVTLRHEAGLERFRHLITKTDRNDPCEFACAAPPWLAERTFDTMSLTVRITNVFSAMGLQTVSDLAAHSLAEMLGIKNFGRTSVIHLTDRLEAALREGPFSVEAKIDDAANLTLLMSIRRSLLNCEEREQSIVRRRMGLDSPAETLQQIGDDLGITRERVRQIESKAVTRLRREEFWDDLLTKKMAAMLRNRNFPLPVLGVEAADHWFAGMAEFPSVLRYVLLDMCDGLANIVSIDGIDYFAFLDQQRWSASLREAEKLLEDSVGRRWTEDHCRLMVHGLVPEKSREFRTLLWDKASSLCHFADDANGVRWLTSYGRGAEHIVEAVLGASERPLHFTEIAHLASIRAGREIDAHRAHFAAAAIGLLMGRGTYGVERHLPIDGDSLRNLGEEAEEVVADGPTERQWHTYEILASLVERGSDFAGIADKYLIDIALQRSGGLQRLGRLMWVNSPGEQASEAPRIELRQAVISLLQQAGRPLRVRDIQQRLVAIRGGNEHFQIPMVDPLIRVGPGLWGLNDRDISVKRPDQPLFLDCLVDILRHRGFAIHASELSTDTVSLPRLPAAAIFSLATADRRMRVNQDQHLYLREWGGPRREGISEAVQAVLAEASAPLRFDEIVERVEVRVRRPCERNAISGCFQALEAVLDQSTGRWSPSAVMVDDRADDDENARNA